MKTNNPFIAAACDQAGEVCELVQSLTAPAKRPVNCGTSYCSCIECHFPSPAWCASVDAELAATAEADVKSLNAMAADLLRPFLRPGQKVIWREAFRWHDDAGVLSNHYDGMEIESLSEDFGYEWSYAFNFKHAAIVERIDAAPTLPAAAVAEGAQLDGESLEQAE